MSFARTRNTTRASHATRKRVVLRRLPADVTAAIAISCLSALAGLAEEAPADTIAAHIRTQGYTCSAPVTAARDRAASRPNGMVWLLQCAHARYRVQLVPDMPAKVTQLE